MRAERRTLLALLAAAAVTGVPASGLAQDDDPEVAVILPDAATGTTRYDGGDRRDPFVPLTAEGEDAAGPRFESMTLTGIFLGSPGNSLVVLEDAAKRGHFLRLGDTVGDARVIEIRPRSAVFEIQQYGAVRRETLELERSEE